MTQPEDILDDFEENEAPMSKYGELVYTGVLVVFLPFLFISLFITVIKILWNTKKEQK